ncbi:MAG: cation:dicarboxylase symporter family transporter, partial [Anaerovibrio sp.]
MSKKSEGSGLGSLGKWIIIATVLGAVVGLVMGKEAHALAPIGDLFMTLIKMVVVPMVFFSLVGGAASLGNSKSAGKIGAVTFIYYGVTTAVAVGLGLIASELAKPGVGINMSAISGAAIDVDMSQSGSIPGFWETVIGFVPVNPFAALVEGNILQTIVFGLFVGFALSMLEDEKKNFMMKIFNYFTEIFIKIMTGIMY